MKYTLESFSEKFNLGYNSICPICGIRIGRAYMSRHLDRSHGVTPKEVFDSLVGVTHCSVCNSATKFVSLFKGYQTICSPECQKVFSSDKAKLQWSTDNFRNLMTNMANNLWSNPDHISRMRKIFDSEEWSTIHSESAKRMWLDPEIRQSIIESIRGRWSTDYKRLILSNYVSDSDDPYVFYCIKLRCGMIKFGSGMENRPKTVRSKMGGEIIKVINTTVSNALRLESTILNKFWNPVEMMDRFGTIEVAPPESIPFIEELLNENCSN